MFKHSFKVATAGLLILVLLAQTQGLSHAHLDDLSVADCHLCLQLSTGDDALVPADITVHQWVAVYTASSNVGSAISRPTFAFTARGPPAT